MVRNVKALSLNNFAFLFITPSIRHSSWRSWITSSVRGRFTVTTYSFHAYSLRGGNFVHDVTIVGRKIKPCGLCRACQQGEYADCDLNCTMLSGTPSSVVGDPDRFVQRIKIKSSSWRGSSSRPFTHPITKLLPWSPICALRPLMYTFPCSM